MFTILKVNNNFNGGFIMNEQKIDRRIRRTKKLLLQGLTKLMSEKKINKITVTELTDLVDVNRGTFYLYYKDIFDMLEQIETELFNNFNEAFDKFAKDTVTYDNMLSFFIFVFEFVQDNAEICKILLGPDGDYSFIEKFKKSINQHQPSLQNAVSRVKLHYFRPFIISGYLGVIQQWLKDDMKASPKDMAVFITEIISNGVDFLK